MHPILRRLARWIPCRLAAAVGLALATAGCAARDSGLDEAQPFRRNACLYTLPLAASGDPAPPQLDAVLAAAARQARRWGAQEFRGSISGAILVDRQRARSLADAIMARAPIEGFERIHVDLLEIGGIDPAGQTPRLGLRTCDLAVWDRFSTLGPAFPDAIERAAAGSVMLAFPTAYGVPSPLWLDGVASDPGFDPTLRFVWPGLGAYALHEGGACLRGGIPGCEAERLLLVQLTLPPPPTGTWRSEPRILVTSDEARFPMRLSGQRFGARCGWGGTQRTQCLAAFHALPGAEAIVTAPAAATPVLGSVLGQLAVKLESFIEAAPR